MGCKYEIKVAGISGLTCERKPVLKDGYCFWHSQESKKNYKGRFSVKRELEQKNERKDSLEGFVLEGEDLRHIQLGGADLRYSKLKNCKIIRARLQGAEMEGANLAGADLSGTNLRGADLSFVNLETCILREADLSNACLHGAVLDRADLEGAIFRSANLEGAILTNANLFGCDFEGAYLKSANFERANLECTNFISAEIKLANFLGVTFNPLTCIKNVKNINAAIGVPEDWLNAWKKRQEVSALSPYPSDTNTDTTPTTKQISNLKEEDYFGDRNEYKILRKLGKGGYAYVFKVKDMESEIEKVKAIKILDPQLGTDEGNIKRFKREGLIGKNLRHPRIIKVHDLRYSKEFDCYYIIMEFIPGTDLKSLMQKCRMRKQPFPPGVALLFIKQICEGLIVAHENNVIHRDLKPGNILINREGKVIITDFGLSKITQSLSVSFKMSTHPGTLLGTFEYMSPEQVLGEKPTLLIDIYALGVIMYELFTGRSPYTAKNILAWINVIRHFQPLKPCDLNPGIPSWLNDIIIKCMEKNPSNRFSNVQELLEALNKKGARQA